MRSARAAERAGGGFAGYCIRRDDIADLPRVVGADTQVRVELMPVMMRLGKEPPTAFASLADLYAALPDHPGRPSQRAIEALRNLFVHAVDRRLQRLYQQRLAERPPAPDARHADKIAGLQAARGDAYAIVGEYDWDWLAGWLDLPRIGESAESCLRRLSNFAFDVGRVNFRFTYHCNVACRHCYNHSGPDQKAQRLDLDAMRAIVAQMPSVGIDAMNLSGGEPFLYPDVLDTMISAARAAGLREISIFSNGFWATTEAKARQALSRLARAGFMQGADDFLKLSSGVYHQEFIEFERMLIAARTYHAMFGRRLRLDIELPAGVTQFPEDYARRIAAEGVGKIADVGYRSIARLGRAAELAGLKEADLDAPCDTINQIAFDPDGRARPCCGLNNDNHGVVIGALAAQDLRTLVKSMQNDPVLQFIAHNPLTAIRDHLENAPETPPHARHCTVCQALIGGLRDKEPLQAKLFNQQRFYPFWFDQAAIAESP